MNIQDELKKVAIMEAAKTWQWVKAHVEWIRAGGPKIRIPWPKPIKDGIVAINPNLLETSVTNSEVVAHQDSVIFIATKELNQADRELLLKLLG